MKSMYFVTRNSALAVLVFFTPVYSQSWTEWVLGTPAVVVKPAGFFESTQKWLLENQDMVKWCAGTLVMAYCTYRGAINWMKLSPAKDKKSNDKADETVVVIKRENPITINGKNINDIIQPGGVLVCKAAEGTHCLGFEVKGGNINIESLMFKDSSLVDAEVAYVNECKAQRPQMSGGMINMSSGASMGLSGSWMTAQDYISLSALTLLRIEDRLLSCKKIELTGNKMEFDRCYIDTDELIIRAISSGSCCQIIRVTFKKDSSVLKGLQGYIDFAKNETYSDYGLRFIGVEKIEIQCAPHAF